MSPNTKNSHSQQVDAWIQQATKGLPAEKLDAFFGRAIHALWRRSSVTLSDVTLLVIFDRAQIICQEDHPFLVLLKFDAKGVHVDGLKRDRQLSSTELHQGFRCLIIEIITIIGSLTAEILTVPLYKELSLITADQSPSASASSNRDKKNGSKNAEKKHD